VEKRPPRGASTLTQQLAKNLWLSPSRNPWRKAKEALLTWQLERRLAKRRILELYLNVVEFGPGVYGAEAAARHYFDKSAAELSEVEAAQLAAALPRPRAWRPGSDSAVYRRRVASVERRMVKAVWLWREI
jgi:monofunctional biosynthetic peptidoglycan transglycosylase